MLLGIPLLYLKVAAAGLLMFGGVAGSLHAQGGAIAGTRDDRASASIKFKLASIIVPHIEFRSTTLADAIEYLRQESQRLDPDPDPQARGVNIFLKLPAAAGTSAGQAPPSAKTRVTLTLDRIPLLEALKYVASQAGLKVKVEPYAVSLVPLSEATEALITAIFRISPDFLSTGSTGSGAGKHGGTALDEAAAPTR